MKPAPCFEVNKELENAADEAEDRKGRALDHLLAKLRARLPAGRRFEQAMVELIDADKKAVQERGK